MSAVRPAAGGGRLVDVPAARVAGWFDRFAERHGGTRRTELEPSRMRVRAADGTTATVEIPFGPLPDPTGEILGTHPGLVVGPLVEHLARPRTLGLVLVRLGGHSIGVLAEGRVLASTTDRKPVHGRNKAGGWSQRRFARRRAGQARDALRAAADDIVRLLVPRLDELAAVVLGGDRRALDALRADPRLAGVFALAEPTVLDVPEPRRRVLDEAAVRACGIRVLVREPVIGSTAKLAGDDPVH